MNYLAHILLAGPSPQAQLGGLLGDFVKPGEDAHLDVVTQREIRLHRVIDAYTDAHPVVLNAKSRFRPRTRRYAGILLDVYYDHLLARDWPCYADTPLDAFVSDFYQTLSGSPLPPRLARIAPHMVAQDWLGSYQHFSGVETAIVRLSGRLSRGAEAMIEGLADLQRESTRLESGFQQFFPELRRHAAQRRAAFVQ